MSRSRKNKNGVPVSLFPFLAVLLCTMGSLVMLLVAMNHIARNRTDPADTPVAQEPAPSAEELEERRARSQQLQEIEDQTKELAARNDEVDAALKEEHLRLSQIEGHIGRLTDRLRSLRAAFREMVTGGDKAKTDRLQAERKLAQLKDLIAEVKTEISELEEQQGQHKSFEVVPYRGANGTQRKPIYIECRNGSVVLQPEGVELTADDFRRPLGVGNPLASALRASREYYARQNPAGGYDPDAEPYPLILVRPDGIEEYYAVRDAIRSWDSDFGYEMVDDDWDLKFPAPDPALYQQQVLAIRHARLRRQMLARAAPSAYGGAGLGGVTGTGEGSPYDGLTLGPADGAVAGQAAGGSEGTDQPAGVFAALSQNPTNPQGAARGGEAGPSSEETPNSGQRQALRAESQRSQGQQSAAAGNGASGDRYAPAQSQAAGGGNQANNSSMGAASPSFEVSNQQQGNRSADWAIDEHAPTDIAIRRPISVVVRRNTLELGGGNVPIDGSTEAALDGLVASVRRTVKSWGIAGRGLYWRPVLSLHVSPDAVDRARDLTRLLQQSGIEITYPQTATATQGGLDATR